jgi:hypothetical protein
MDLSPLPPPRRTLVCYAGGAPKPHGLRPFLFLCVF